MIEPTRDYPGHILPDEIDIIHKRENYAIAIEKGKKMYGPEKEYLNYYFLITDVWTYRIDNRYYKRIIEADFDEEVIEEVIRICNNHYHSFFKLDE